MESFNEIYNPNKSKTTYNIFFKTLVQYAISIIMVFLLILFYVKERNFIHFPFFLLKKLILICFEL